MLAYWPQLALIAYFVLGFGIALARHGQTSREPVNALYTMFRIGIIVGLLYAGGFWS